MISHEIKSANKRNVKFQLFIFILSELLEMDKKRTIKCVYTFPGFITKRGWLDALHQQWAFKLHILEEHGEGQIEKLGDVVF